MSNPIFIRISEKVTLLTKEEEFLKSRIHTLTQTDQHLKSDMHTIEFKLALDNSDATSFHELNELRHDHRSIKNNEHTLSHLNEDLKELQKLIEKTTFWMKRADTNDEVRQKEAEKRVFG